MARTVPESAAERSGDDDPEAVADDRSDGEQADAGDGGPGRRAQRLGAVVGAARRHADPGREPDEGEGDETTIATPIGSETTQTTSRDPQAMDMLRSSQAAAVAGTGAGTSLTLWAVTGRRRDAA